MLQEVLSFFMRYMVFALMLSVGLALGRGEVRNAIARRGVLQRGLLLVEIVVPLLALAIVFVLRLEPRVAAVILLMAICPGVALIPAIARKPGGDIGMVLVLLLVVSVLAPLTLAVWGAVFARVTPLELVVTPAVVLRTTVAKIFIPLALGAALRLLFPRAAPALARAAHLFFIVSFVAIVAVAIVRGGPILLELDARDVAAMILIVGTSLLLGHALGGPRLEDRVALAIFAALGNPALALAVAAVSYPDVRAAPWIAAYVLLRASILAPYTLWARRHSAPVVGAGGATPVAGGAH